MHRTTSAIITPVRLLACVCTATWCITMCTAQGIDFLERVLLEVNDTTLAPAPAPGDAGQPPVVDVTSRSFFVLTANTGTLTRTPLPSAANAALLTLSNVDPNVTWFSEAPIRQTGAMLTSKFANHTTFEDPGQRNTWLNGGNAAVSYTDASTGARGTVILALSDAPHVTYGAITSWALNVTLNNNSGSSTRVVTALNASALVAAEPMERDMTDVTIFFSGVCYQYDRYTANIAGWFYCTNTPEMARKGSV